MEHQGERMDFKFTEEQEAIFSETRRFAREELEPHVIELDRKGEPNLDGLKKLGELGYMGMNVSEEYGGVDVGAIAYAGVLLEMSKFDAGTAVAMSVHNSLVNESLVVFGTPEQKREFLPKLASGEWLGCFSLTEADAGSDPGTLRMSAVLDGDHYVLNGTKTFVTSGDIADLAVVFGQTDMKKGAKGLSAFLVPKGTPGFEPGTHEEKMGLRSATCTELVFTDCRIPKENLLGTENRGLKIALQTLDSGRIGIAAQAIGIAEAALDESVRYANERVQFGKPIAAFQGIQFMLADMATEIELARTMLVRVAWMKETKQENYSKPAAMLKLYAGEMSHRVCHKAVQIHGGYGYMKEYKVERLYRDQRVTEIYEGTSEIQRIVIARHVLS